MTKNKTLCVTFATAILFCVALYILTGFKGLSLIEDPYHEASINGDISRVQHYLATGISVDLPDENGDTPLYLALSNKQWKVAQMLVDRNANVNARHFGISMAEAFAWDKNKKAYSWLLQHGAKGDPDAQAHFEGSY